MKKNKIFNIILCCLIITIYANSCTKIMDYDDTNFQKMLVINGVIYQDSIVRINISRNKSILEADSILPFMDNATAKLFENETYIETLVYDSMGFYHSNLITKAKTSYRIEVEVPDYEKAIAYFNFEEIENFSVSNIEYLINDTLVHIDYPENKDTLIYHVNIKADINFTDNENQINHYDFMGIAEMLNFYSTNYLPEIGEEGFYTVIEESSNNKMWISFDDYNDYEKYGYTSSGSHNGYQYNFYFKDDLYNGKPITFSISGGYYTSSPNNVEIYLVSYPDDYIKFHSSGYNYMNTLYNPFSQPVNIYSNVENGIGLVCGITCEKVIINLN